MQGMTRTHIANMALALLGSASRIARDDDGSPLSFQLIDVWDIAARSLMESYPWNFAIVREQLLRDGDFVAPGTAYAFRYRLPPLTLRWLPPDRGDADHFQAEQEGDYLLSNEEGPIVVRTLRWVADITLWPMTFVNAMAARIAYLLAESVAASASLRDRMQVLEAEAIDAARRSDALSTGRDRRASYAQRSSFVAARFRGGGYSGGYWDDAYRFGR